MNKFVLIAAGGTGKRLKTAIPKQFVQIAGKPVIIHAIEAFVRYDSQIQLIIVLPDDYKPYWDNLCAKQGFSRPYTVVSGGPTRFHSVKSGLKHVPDDTLVAIHDGVRPLVSTQTIERAFFFAEKYGNAIPVIDVNDSLRITDHALSKPLPRERVKLVQTPQCFKSNLIKDAYNQNFCEDFTDDASILESRGGQIHLVDGNRENLKITYPQDLVYALSVLKSQGV